MKKLIALFTVVLFIAFGISNTVFAQDSKQATASDKQKTENVTEVTEETTEEVAGAARVERAEDPDTAAQESLHFVLKNKFIEGGTIWMAPILLCLILGLALVIERIFYLNFSTINSGKFLEKIDDAIKTGGIEKAKELCRDTKGPIAGVFYQGLDRFDEGMESVEKAVVSYGGVQMSKLETNLSWIALFLAFHHVGFPWNSCRDGICF